MACVTGAGRMLDRSLIQSCLSRLRFSYLPLSSTALRLHSSKPLANGNRLVFTWHSRRKLFDLIPACLNSASGPEFEILHMEEHSDGSLVFKFGVPETEQSFTKSATNVNGSSVMDAIGANSLTDSSPKRVKTTAGEEETCRQEPEKIDLDNQVEGTDAEEVAKDCNKDFRGHRFDNEKTSGSTTVRAEEQSPVDITSAPSSVGVEDKLCETPGLSSHENGNKIDHMQTGKNVPVSKVAQPLNESQKSDIEASDDQEKISSSSFNDAMGMQEETVLVEGQNDKNLCLDSAFQMLPHPSKSATGGEDAYFVTGNNWIGVADGVGQWALEGINPGLFAQELMENCRRIASGENSDIDPKQVLAKSAMESTCPGSSTAVVACLIGETFHVVNLGDSGFLVIRGGTVNVKSSPMTHGFNFPYQIEKGDDPSSIVETYNINVDEGDVIVMATDGLFDNLYDHEIASDVETSLRSGLEPKEIATVLAQKAQERGKYRSGSTPFSDAAQAAGYTTFCGGKLDDVTVIVSFVKLNPK